MMGEPVLDVRDLVTHFPIREGLLRKQVGTVHAVDGVSFHLDEQETLGVVGESGCGKSTLGRSVLRLVEPSAGSVVYRGEDITAASRQRMRALRSERRSCFRTPSRRSTRA
jgi:ABC-type oligopeptide transport system ATPase subunit